MYIYPCKQSLGGYIGVGIWLVGLLHNNSEYLVAQSSSTIFKILQWNLKHVTTMECRCA